MNSRDQTEFPPLFRQRVYVGLCTLALLLPAGRGHAQAPDFAWARSGSGGGPDSAAAVAVDGAGNVYVTGSFQTSADFSGATVSGPNERTMVFVAKYDNAGDLLWVRSSSGSGSFPTAFGKGIAVDSAGDIAVVGTFHGLISFGSASIQNTTGYETPFVAKYRGDGTPLWARAATRTSSCCSHDATAVGIDLDANVFIAGSFQYSATFDGIVLSSSSSYNAFYAKYDQAGNVIWAKKFGSPGAVFAKALAVDTSGNFSLIGDFFGPVNFGGVELSSASLGSIFIVQGDSAGEVLWAKQIDSLSEEESGGISLDGQGNVYVTAGPPGLLAKYDGAGNLRWTRAIGGHPRKVASDAVGNVSVCGIFTGAMTIGSTTLTSSGQYDVFVAQYDSAGNFRWAKRAGRFFDDIAGGVAADPAGNVLVAGSFYESASFDSVTLNGNGDDAFIAKLGNNSVPLHPVIQAQPQNQTVSPGATATFGVMASGAPPLQFQWRFNGTNIPGGTHALLTITNALLADAGSYDVMVMNDAGSTNSAVATLTVVPGTPNFADHFSERGIMIGFTNYVAGNNSLFTREAGEPDHAGRKGNHSGWLTWTAPDNGTCVVDTLDSSFDTVLAVYVGSVVSGLKLVEANDDLTPGTLQSRVAFSAAGGVEYQIAVDGYSAADVGNISFHLSFSNAAPIITVQPQSRSVLAGSNITFTVSADGNPPLTYQWRFNGTNLPGSTSGNHTVNNVQPANEGGYSVVVANSFGSITSSVATLTVLRRPVITAPPQSQTVTAGDAAAFSLIASGTVPLSYQWRFNGAEIGGAFGTSFTVSNAQPADGGGYSVVVSNPYGSVTSAVAMLAVNFSLTVNTNGNGSVTRNPDQASYAPGSVVIVTAHPGSGAFFVNWSGDASEADNPLSVTMSSNKVIAANFTATSLALATEGPGTIEKSPDQAFYSVGEQVTLTARPARWHTFARWSDGPTVNPRIITIGPSNSYTAVFMPTQALETLSFSNVTRTAPVGMPAIFVDGVFIPSGSVTNFDAARVDILSSFTNETLLYTLDGTAPGLASTYFAGPFIVRQDALVRAVAFNADFTQAVEADPVEIRIARSHALTAGTAGGGAVRRSPDAARYLAQSSVTITATPDEGWRFVQWLGDAGGTNPTANVTLNQDMCVEAVFGTGLNTTAVGNGSVVVSPATAVFPYGTVARLTALPEAGHYFAFWGGAGGGTNNPLSIPVTNAQPTVTAVFQPLSGGEFALAVVADGFGSVNYSPRGNRFHGGQTVTLTALPEADQQFLSWSGDASGTQNPLSVTMDQSRVIRAHFTSRPHLSFPTCLDAVGGDRLPLWLRGKWGVAYAIESAPNVAGPWVRLLTVTNEFGRTQFPVPGVTNGRAQFYRAAEE